MQPEEIEFPYWHGSQRADGVRVMPNRDDRAPTTPPSWRIVFPSGLMIDECPCCDFPLPSARAAKLLAEAVYPCGRIN
jgi:hypothetical protein